MNIKSGLSFIATHIEVKGELPFEVTPGHAFRRARVSEIEFFERQFEKVGGTFMWGALPYRCIAIKNPIPQGYSIDYEELPFERWKYWVVGFEGTNARMHEVKRAAALLPIDLEFGMEMYFDGANQEGNISGWSVMPFHMIEAFQLPKEHDPQTFDAASLGKIPIMLQQLGALSEEHDFIKRAYENFFSLRNIPRGADLRVITCFSILEALITHAPRLTETLDSISHQISSKSMLLHKRFARLVNVEDYFGVAMSAKIWKRLYAYRSCLVHGTTPDFEGDLRPLRDRENATAFLKDFTKELLIFALGEPELIKDLKAC